MKSLFLTLLMALTPGVVVTEAQAGQSNTSVDEVQAEAADAAQTLKEYAVDRKDEAVAEANRLLADLDRRIEHLQADIDSASDEAKARMRITLDALAEKRRAAAKRIDSLQASSAEAWADMKQGFIGAYDELKSAYREAKKDLGS